MVMRIDPSKPKTKKAACTFAAVPGLLLLAVLASLQGCSYHVPTDVSPAVNIYSSYGNKIPGKYYLVLDDDMKNINRKIAPTSHICSAHTYPINVQSAFSVSVTSTLENVFEEVVETRQMPDAAFLRKNNGDGVVFVRLKRFEPRIRFLPGFWEATALSKCDLVFEVSIKNARNRQIAHTTFGASRSAEGASGEFCSQGAEILSRNIYETTREAMERLAEKIANHAALRQGRSRGRLASREPPREPKPDPRPDPEPKPEAGPESNSRSGVDQPRQERDTATRRQRVQATEAEQPEPPKNPDQVCFDGRSDEAPDNDAINMAEALMDAKCKALSRFRDEYPCRSSHAVYQDFRQTFGDSWDMQVKSRHSGGICIRICTPRSP
jgi:hypothetical protein